MNVPIKKIRWATYFEEFNRRNRWRLTTLAAAGELEKCESNDAMSLVGVSLETDHEGATRIHIMLGGVVGSTPRNRTITITDVKRIVPKCGPGGLVESLEIEDQTGAINLFRLETPPALLPAAELLADHEIR
jgi:hypothetical protein